MSDTNPLDLALIDWRHLKANEWLVSEPVQDSLDDIPALIAEVRRLREEAKTLANGLERVYELSEDPDGNSNEIRDAISEVADEALIASGRMLPDGAIR